MSTLLTQFTNKLKDILIEKYDVPEEAITDEALFVDMDLDELDAVEFIMDIEKLYNQSVPDDFAELILKYPFKRFCDALHKKLGEPGAITHATSESIKSFLNHSGPKYISPGTSTRDEPTVVYPKVEDIDPNAYNVMRLAEGLPVMRSTWLCKTQNLGLHGNAFGGDLFCHLDEVSAAFVAEIIDTPLVVTVSANVQFKAFVKAGKLLKTYCSIKNIGSTSITIDIEMRKYNVKTEKETLCVSAEMIFVRIDGDGEKIPIERSVKEKYSKLVDIQKRNTLTEIEKLILQYKAEELPEADVPFHHEAEVWAGMKFFMEWLKKKK